MKKILLFFILGIYLLFPFSSFAADEGSSSCPITDSNAQVFTDYIKNIRTLVTNVNNYLSENSPSNSKFEKTTSDISRIFYQAVTWDGYFLDFDYYIISPLFNELPSKMKRDVELLEGETNGLRKYLKTITKSGYSQINIPKESVCQGVENCDFTGSAGSIIGDVIVNNIQLTNYLKEILVSERSDFSTQVKLLPMDSSSFTQKLVKNYGVNARSQCSQDDGEFGKRIDDAIEAISLNNKEGKDGLKKWREAWNLLLGAVSGETNQELEKNLLQKELARQGLSTNQQAILLQNLEDFNENGFYSLENNFITNTAMSIKDAAVKIQDGFSKATDGLFSEEKTQEINQQKSIGLTDFNTLNENEVITETIKQRLDNTYSLNKSFLSVQDYQTNSVIGELIDIHSNITLSTKTLEAKCKLAVKVCNSQGYGDGNCGTCK